MQIYELESDVSFRVLRTGGSVTDESSYDFIRQFWNGTPIENWSPLPIHFESMSEALEMEYENVSVAHQRFANGIGDCPFYSAAFLILSPRAYDGLFDLLSAFGQFLPIPLENEGTFYSFNCTTNLDALDRTRSDVEYYDGGLPGKVNKYVFLDDVIGNCRAFRLNWPRTYRIFVTDTVVERIAQLRLRGFIARQVS